MTTLKVSHLISAAEAQLGLTHPHPSRAARQPWRFETGKERELRRDIGCLMDSNRSECKQPKIQLGHEVF